MCFAAFGPGGRLSCRCARNISYIVMSVHGTCGGRPAHPSPRDGPGGWYRSVSSEEDSNLNVYYEKFVVGLHISREPACLSLYSG